MPTFPQALEIFTISSALNGQNGSNRASGAGQLAANNDLEAIQAWLAEFQDSPHTQRHYRKEVERLMLWAVVECGKPLSSLTREDFVRYEQFLRDPQPRERWCGPRAARFSAEWRPFRGPLRECSRRTAMIIIDSLLNYLVQGGYLAGNPLALMRRRRTAPDEAMPLGTERFLEPDQWQAVLDAIEALPQDTARRRQHYERARFLVALLYLLGPRVGEVASHTMGSFVELRGRWWWVVTGKGRKTARVPVNQDMLQALQNYRRSLNLPPLPTPNETTPLISRLNGSGPLTDSVIYRIIKTLVHKAADRLHLTNPAQAAHLRQASTHWFRHTSITHQVESGIDLTLIQRNARHSKLTTTTLYFHADEARWHAAMERHRLRKRTPS